MKFTKITSPSNPLIRDIVRIKQKPARHNAFLIEGPHLIGMAAASPHVVIGKVLFTEGFASKKQGRRLLRLITHTAVMQRGREVASLAASFFEISENILHKLADTESPQGIVAVASYSPAKLEEIEFKGAPFLAVCDGIQDPGNLGTIIRVADAAGADAAVILPGTCDIFNPKAVRSTTGSLFNIPIVYSAYDALAGYLDTRGIKLYLTDVRAEPALYESDLRQPVALAFGGEARGAGASLLEKAHALIKIPIIGRAESLNVAAAAAVCLYEVVRQRRFS